MHFAVNNVDVNIDDDGGDDDDDVVLMVQACRHYRIFAISWEDGDTDDDNDQICKHMMMTMNMITMVSQIHT